MAVPVPFTDNYSDLSTERGFQFRFCCERCGNGYLSAYQHSVTGLAGGALQAASGLLGGVFGRAASSAYDIQNLIGGPQHDAAMRKAVEEIKPLFHQCKRCGQWVCGEICWNDLRGQCCECSPKIDQEIAAIESQATLHQLREKAMQDTDFTGGAKMQSAAAARNCPSCDAEVAPGQKFCGECGTSMVKPQCPSCNADVAPGKKFCGECGTKI
ncbi:MAG TPA: zinc ribbon domain-containing protein [Abditibacteriaceae bacterium]|jgi:hypothetical protein